MPSSDRWQPDSVPRRDQTRRISDSAHISASKKALYIGALGVVFGDIGTSPLYTLQTIFSPTDPHPIPVSDDNLMGILSMLFWSVMTIVTLTYVILVMRADNDGEGGIMALITKLSSGGEPGSTKTKRVLVSLGIFGAALFFGDSMITPAISVLSAVEGVGVAAPSLKHLVLPVTFGVILALFSFQRFGTGLVGRAFGPVMVVWFSVIGLLGVHGIADDPTVLKALSPTYAVEFAFDHVTTTFFALGSIVLAVTGAEALYADMGHFGRRPITWAWVSLVLPALTLCYFGQGALILDDPSVATGSPFFQLGPDWVQWPLIVLATMATVIASQAVISGAFSVAHQAIRLGYLPRLRIMHTSAKAIGQIYVPWINWLLMVSVLLLIATFESSSRLAFAYGVAVVGTITITTLLFLYVARQEWRTPLWIVIGGGAFLIAVDLAFLSANLIKLFHGAWMPLLIGLLAFTVMLTWKRGVAMVAQRRERFEGPIGDFIEEFNSRIPPLPRAPGTAVFMDRDPDSVPLAMRACVDHLHTLPENVLILTLNTASVPHMSVGDLIQFDDLGYDDGIARVEVTLGYMDRPKVPLIVKAIEETGEMSFDIDADTATYFLSTVEVQSGHVPGLPKWQKPIFIATSHIASDPANYFALPQERTVILGSKIEI